MKNKIFFPGIIFILIFGIIGMGCEVNSDYNNYGGGSGGSGSAKGNDYYGGSGESGGSGSDNRDPNYNNGSGIIIIGGSGSGSNSSYKVKFTVTSDTSGTPVDITYSYPKNNGYNWSTGSYDKYTRTETVNTFPWEYTVSISSKVIGGGVSLKASGSTTQTLTVKIFVDGNLKASDSKEREVFIKW